MDRAQKQQAVDSLKEQFTSANTVVVAHYHGLSVDDMNELRAKAREAGTQVRVSKNSLAKIAANDTPFDSLKDYLNGPTALFISDDAVAPAKTVVDFNKDNEILSIVGGVFDGTPLDESGIRQLAKTPSIEESRAKLVGLLNAPAQRIATLLQAPAGQVARVIGARGEQSE